jgi:hypothetical protein
MANYFVRVDHLTDEELSFFGWEVIDRGNEYSAYWNARYNEVQPVSNGPPRFIVVDDLNDARNMSRGGFLITGPYRRLLI